MRFEETIYKAASSFVDYRKKIVKRLKKLQKSFKPEVAAAEAQAAQSQPKKGVSYEVMEKQLRDKFGEKLKYIVFHADAAIAALSKKDAQRAAKVKLHTDQAEQWAVDLAVCTSDEIKMKLRRNGKVRQADHIRRRPGFLERVREHLEQRVDNTRSHVVQIIHQDIFLEENLTKVEDMFLDVSDPLSGAFAAMKGRDKIIGTLMKQAGESDEAGLAFVSARDMKKTFQQVRQMSIPFPRKGATYDEVKRISLLHIDRIKICGSLMASYVMLTTEDKLQLRGLLKESYSMAVEGIRYLMEYYSGDDEREEIQLEDAWNKMLEYQSPIGKDIFPSSKRRKLNKPITRTKVLFSPGHVTPSNIIHELKSRDAELFRTTDDAGARILIKFGNAFEMRLFFRPLLVTVRAINPRAGDGPDIDNEGRTAFQRDVIDCGLPTWRSASDGLSEVLELKDSAHDAAIKCMIAKKLECASAKATLVLRKCFADIDYTKTRNDFEVALEEGSSLLHFLRLAKDRYNVSET